MKTFRAWLIGLGVLAVVGGALWGYWNFELRWRPHKITKHQAEITKLLEQSGWVSPGLQGPKLYMVSFRSCPDCIRFKTEQFEALHKAGVDTRVIEVARADRNGVAKSTPPERATVAELWVNRSWALAERWDATPVDAWNAPGITPADGDVARTAVVEAGRKMVADLGPLLQDNGFGFDRVHFPTLIWWTKDGELHGCACEDRRSYGHVLKELGVGE
jgi:hypothetical protein